MKIVPKSELSSQQAQEIAARIQAPEHADDLGPIRFWDVYSCGLYAAVEDHAGDIVGIIEASGPKDGVVPAWWIDTRFRGKGFGTKLIDALAPYLRSRGYTGVGDIAVQTSEGRYDGVSSRLAARFVGRFPRDGG